jgi:multidrug transporter EmrE-like cation transporter
MEWSPVAMTYGLLAALAWGISTLLAAVAALRERLRREQVGGTMLILAGLILLGVGS